MRQRSVLEEFTIYDLRFTSADAADRPVAVFEITHSWGDSIPEYFDTTMLRVNRKS